LSRFRLIATSRKYSTTSLAKHPPRRDETRRTEPPMTGPVSISASSTPGFPESIGMTSDGSGIGDRERERQWVSRRFDRVIFRALEPRARREVCSSEWRHEIGNLACLAQCLFPRTRSAAGARQSGFLERPKWGDESKPA